MMSWLRLRKIRKRCRCKESEEFYKAEGSQEKMTEGYRNPCLTMHQPWASLLVSGIKRIEGRSWPAPVRGRLWIHAAGKVPEPATIQAMEEFYREIYRVDGITELKFPEHYPVSQLLGCVNVVGCVKCEELVSWEDIPNGVRLEGQTDFCWLCEDPQKLVIPFGMRGYQRVYNLERKIFAAAVRGLRPVQGPLPVKFPLPDPSNPFSLKPGVLASYLASSQENLVKPPALDAAIAGARAAATQFTRTVPVGRFKSSQTEPDRSMEQTDRSESNWTIPHKSEHGVGLESNPTERTAEEDGRSEPNRQMSDALSTRVDPVQQPLFDAVSSAATTQIRINKEGGRCESNQSLTRGKNQVGRLELNQTDCGSSSSRIFAAAVRGLRSTQDQTSAKFRRC